MSIEVTVVNGKQFVSGLRWHLLNKVRSHKKEAKKISAEEGWDMVTIRRTRTSIMAGFAPRGRHGLKGMYSLAAALGGQLGDNWVGIFRISDDRFALAAVNKGEVMPGYDAVGDAAEIEALARECYSTASSNDASDAPRIIRVIAPPEFKFGDEHLELKDILVPRAIRREHRLRPVRFGLTRAQVIAYGAAALVIGGFTYGGKTWWEARRHDEEVALAKQQLEEQQRQQSNAIVEQDPWALLPSADVVLDACKAHLDAMPLSIGGWIFKGAVCGPGQARADYAKNAEVSEKDFVAAAKEITGAPPALDNGFGVITFGRAMPPSGREELRPLGLVVLDVSSHLVRFSGTTFSPKEDPAAAQQAPGMPEVLPKPWVTLPFEITSAWPPQQLLSGIDTAGIRIKSVETALSPETGELAWTIKGEIYATR